VDQRSWNQSPSNCSGHSGPQTITDLAVEHHHDDKDDDYKRVDDVLAVEVTAVDSTTERVLNDQI